MRRVVIVAAVLFLLNGCMGLSKTKIKELPKNTSILIISAVGNSLGVYDSNSWKSGILIDSIDVSSWQLNTSIENLLYDSLEGSRFKLMKHHEFSDKLDIKLVPGKKVTKPDLLGIKEKLIVFCDQKNIDTVIIISEDRSEYGNVPVIGYGITRAKSILGTKTVAGLGFTCINMTMYDAKTMNKITSTLNYDVFAAPPELTDALYDPVDWKFFLSQEDLYKELFKSNIDAIIKVSGFCDGECNAPEPFLYR